MAANYLGDFEVEVADTPFALYTPSDWALYFIASYGGIDGSHHKDWVLDQVARILNGTPVLVKEARWGPSSMYPEGHAEYRPEVGDASQTYRDWVHKIRDWNEETQEYDYDYEAGIAP